MKHFFMTLLVIAPLIFSTQTQASDHYNWDQFKTELTSPWNTPAKTPLLIGAGATLLIVMAKDPYFTKIHRDLREHEPLGDLAEVGDIMGQLVPNVAYVLGMGLHGWSQENAESKRRAWLMFKATAWSTGTTTVLKYTFREPRPNDHSTRNSFPSGHTTSAFAFASVVAAEHEWYWGVGAYSIATLVGVSRINDNAHYPRDVMAGATIGMAYGLGLYYLDQKKKEESTLKEKTNAFLIPLVEDQGLAMMVTRDL